MNDRGQRLVDDLVPGVANLEGKVAVFVRRGLEAGIKAPEPMEQLVGHHQARPGAEVDFGAKLYFGWLLSSSVP